MRSRLWGKRRIAVFGAGLALSALGVAAPATAAFADSACYTGCTSPSISSTSPSQGVTTQSQPTQTTSSSSSSGLPLTGADIEELAAIGAGAVLVGGVLVRRSRRSRRAVA